MTSPYRDQSTVTASIFQQNSENGNIRVSPTQQLSNQSEANDLNDDRYASVKPAQGNQHHLGKDTTTKNLRFHDMVEINLSCTSMDILSSAALNLESRSVDLADTTKFVMSATVPSATNSLIYTRGRKQRFPHDVEDVPFRQNQQQRRGRLSRTS